MANTVELLKPTVWSRRIQAFKRTSLVARGIANFEEQSGLFKGKTVNRPYITEGTVQDLTLSDGTYNRQDITTTNEALTVDKWKAFVSTFTKDEMKQVKYLPALAAQRTRHGGHLLATEIDRLFLNEVVNASYTKAGAAYTSSTIQAGISEAKATLRDNRVETDRPWHFITDGQGTSIIEQTMIASGFGRADKTLVNGYMGNFLGLRVFESQVLRWTGEVLFAINPSANDTITVNGVVSTFKASPAAAGDIDVGVDAATSADNFTAAINGGAGAGSAYIEYSAADRLLLGNITAVDNATSVTIVSNKGRIAISASLTGSGNGVSTMVLHCPLGKKGHTDLVVQLDISTEIKDISGRLGKDYVTDALFGYKTFQEGADRFMDFKMTTAANDINA